MAEDQDPDGLDAAYGAPATAERRTTGDPGAPPAAATETLGELMIDEAEARTAQADRADADKAPEDDPAGKRRERAYALWEQEGRPEGRHEAHWQAAGEEPPEPGTAPWTEGP